MRHVCWCCVMGLALFLGATRLQAREDQGEREVSPTLAQTQADSDTPPSEVSRGPLPDPDEEGKLAPEAPQRISMEFQDASLKEVLKTFSRQTGINVIASTDVGDQPITLFLEDVTFMDALDQILRAGNLIYERTPGSDIYIVRPKSQVTAPETMTRVYRLKYGRVSQSVLARAAAVFGRRTPFETKLIAMGGAASSSSSGGTATSSSGTGSEQGEVGVDTVIKELLTKDGKVIVDGRTNSLIVSDVPENFPRIEAALAALDVRTSQIMVDAELIETTMDKAKELGFEWGSTVATLTPGSRQTRFPFGSLGEGIAPSGVTTPFTMSTLSAASFTSALKALETDTNTKILARPKVLTLDNESALIRLTTQEAIGFMTSSQSTTGVQSVEPERFTTGILLVVTPQVNEHGYITLLVEPSVTKTVKSQVTPPPPQVASSTRDPKTRSSRTLVRIRSGDTLVVGGLIDRSEEEERREVPILAGIPFLGEAFKKNTVNSTASELIVFITPRVLDEPTEAQLASSLVPTPLGVREQESGGAQQETIETTLNALERQQTR